MTGLYGIGLASVKAEHLADDAVTAAKVKDGDLTTAHLSATAGITGAQLSATAGITGAQLSATAGITGAQLSATAAIAGSQLAAAAAIADTQLASGAPSRITWLAAPDQIGDWIGTTVVNFTDVDVSDDGVAAGAKFAVVSVTTNPATANTYLRVRKNGSADDAAGGNVGYANTVSGGWYTCFFIVELDANRVFEAKWSGSIGGSSTAWVVGYVK